MSREPIGDEPAVPKVPLWIDSQNLPRSVDDVAKAHYCLTWPFSSPQTLVAEVFGEIFENLSILHDDVGRREQNWLQDCQRLGALLQESMNSYDVADAMSSAHKYRIRAGDGQKPPDMDFGSGR